MNINKKKRLAFFIYMIIFFLSIQCINVVCEVEKLDNYISNKKLDVPAEQWNKSFNISNYDCFIAIRQTSDNGFISVGMTSIITSINPETFIYNIWLVKTDQYGNHQWNKTFGGTKDCIGDDIEITKDGGYIILGTFYKYGNINNSDIWLLKTDENGNMEWNVTFGDYTNESGYDVEITNDDGFLIVGSDEYNYNSNETNALVIKTDENGIYEWNKTYGGSNNGLGVKLIKTTDDNYIFVGRGRSFGKNSSDVWLVKIDNDGEELWNYTYGGSMDDFGSDIEQTNDDGYIITGSCDINMTLDFTGPYILTNYSSNVYLLKVDKNGVEEWNKSYGGIYTDGGQSLLITSDSGYLVLGYNGYNTTLLYLGNDLLYFNYTINVWLLKFDKYGNLLWNITFSKDDTNYGEDIQKTSDDGYILACGYGNNMSFQLNNPINWTETLNYNGWLIKIGPENIVNNPPIIFNENPKNNIENEVRPPLNLNCTVEDLNNDTMSIYFRWINQTPIVDKWDSLMEWINVVNGTYCFSPSISNDWIWGNTTYTWSVNVTDGFSWTNKTFTFTTGGSRYDVSNNDLVNFQDAGLCWVNRDSVVDYDGLYDVNQNGAVNFQDAGLCWVNRD